MLKLRPCFLLITNVALEATTFHTADDYIRKLLTKFLFQNKVLHPNSGRNKVGIVIIAAQEVSRILSHNLKSCRESPDQQK